jgi:hypothetical protein
MLSEAMKNFVRLYAFWYGCFGALFSLGWYVAAGMGRAAIPSNVWVIEAVFVLHAAAALATFHRAPVLPAWRPVLSVTPSRVRLAKTLLALSIMNFVACLGAFIFAVVRGDLALENKTVFLVLTSFLLQNTIYIAVHWALRPENLFSASFLRAISNPLGLLFPSGKNH